MLPFLRRHKTLAELEQIAIDRTSGIRRMIAVIGIIFLVVITFLVSMLVLNPMFELHALKQEKKLVEEKLRIIQQEEKEAKNRYLWTSDPEYFENLARDRAGMVMEGETVIRPPKEDEAPEPDQEPKSTRKRRN